jgi:hypothetical protein
MEGPFRVGTNVVVAVRTIDEEEINTSLPRSEIKTSTIALQLPNLGLLGMAIKQEAFRFVVGHPGRHI